MFGYLPEKTYNALKDKEEYINLLNETKLVEIRTVNNFKDSFYSDYKSINFFNPENFKEKLFSLIDEYCPETKFITMLHLESYKMTKEELLKYWKNKNNYTPEERLFIIGAIYPFTCVDDTYREWQKIYKDEYELISEEDKKNLSAHCHEDYLAKASCYEIYNLADTHPENFLELAIKILRDRRDYVLTLCPKESADTMNHTCIEISNVVVGCLAKKFKFTSAELLKKSGKILYPDKFFQHQTSCYGIMSLYDQIFDIFFTSRYFIEAFYILKRMFKYIDNGLTNKESFFRGLQYYDKVNQYGALCLVRKMIKLSNLIPELDLKFKNLSKEDIDFILADKNVYEKDKFSSNNVAFTFEYNLNKVDKFIENYSETIELLKIQGIDKRIKRILDGEKIELYPTLGEIINGTN